MHDCEVHAYERHACKIHAHETYAYEVYLHTRETPVKYPLMRYTLVRCTRVRYTLTVVWLFGGGDLSLTLPIPRVALTALSGRYPEISYLGIWHLNYAGA
jgi:hypothetical protein